MKKKKNLGRAHQPSLKVCWLQADDSLSWSSGCDLVPLSLCICANSPKSQNVTVPWPLFFYDMLSEEPAHLHNIDHNSLFVQCLLPCWILNTLRIEAVSISLMALSSASTTELHGSASGSYERCWRMESTATTWRKWHKEKEAPSSLSCHLMSIWSTHRQNLIGTWKTRRNAIFRVLAHNADGSLEVWMDLHDSNWMISTVHPFRFPASKQLFARF